MAALKESSSPPKDSLGEQQLARVVSPVRSSRRHPQAQHPPIQFIHTLRNLIVLFAYVAQSRTTRAGNFCAIARMGTRPSSFIFRFDEMPTAASRVTDSRSATCSICAPLREPRLSGGAPGTYVPFTDTTAGIHL